MNIGQHPFGDDFNSGKLAIVQIKYSDFICRCNVQKENLVAGKVDCQAMPIPGKQVLHNWVFKNISLRYTRPDS